MPNAKRLLSIIEFRAVVDAMKGMARGLSRLGDSTVLRDMIRATLGIVAETMIEPGHVLLLAGHPAVETLDGWRVAGLGLEADSPLTTVWPLRDPWHADMELPPALRSTDSDGSLNGVSAELLRSLPAELERQRGMVGLLRHLRREGHHDTANALGWLWERGFSHEVLDGPSRLELSDGGRLLATAALAVATRCPECHVKMLAPVVSVDAAPALACGNCDGMFDPPALALAQYPRLNAA